MGVGDNKTLPERLRTTVERITLLAERAAQGPWTVDGASVAGGVIIRTGAHDDDGYDHHSPANAALVVELRNAWPDISASLASAAVTLEAAEKAQRVRDAVLAGRDDRITELQARLVAVEAERDEALAALKDEMQWDMGGVPENEWMRRAIAAEARVAENAELKGLKAGGDRPEAVAVAEKLQALAVAAHDFVIQANIYIPPATTRLMGTRRELVLLVDAVLNPAPAAAVRPQTDTPEQALSEPEPSVETRGQEDGSRPSGAPAESENSGSLSVRRRGQGGGSGVTNTNTPQTIAGLRVAEDDSLPVGTWQLRDGFGSVVWEFNERRSGPICSELSAVRAGGVTGQGEKGSSEADRVARSAGDA